MRRILFVSLGNICRSQLLRPPQPQASLGLFLDYARDLGVLDVPDLTTAASLGLMSTLEGVR